MRTQLLSVLVSVIMVGRPPPSAIITILYTRLADTNDVATFFPAPGTGFNEQMSY
jgi:hypothetical protein